ncbi:MAG: hypothetical protein QOI55_1702, partial [Actinomycetota bacterium]|nr:hypothetical protein [Actinomycetota bacterium]
MKTPNVGIPEHLAERLTMAEQHDWLQRNRPSRRSLLRGGALGFGALVAAPALLKGSPAGAASTLTRPASAGPS